MLPLIILDTLHLAPKLLAGSLWKLEDNIKMSSDYILSTKDTHISLKHCPAFINVTPPDKSLHCVPRA
jgi:hypothetical protein